MDGIGGKTMFLEYDILSKQVVQIHENEPTIIEGYNFALHDEFNVGDEFEFTIWINEVNENKQLISFSEIRNNPNAKRLLEENVELKERLKATEDMVLQLIMEGMM